MVKKPWNLKYTVLFFFGLIAVYLAGDMFLGHDSFNPPASYHWQHIGVFVTRAAIITAIFAITQRAIFGWKMWHWERKQNLENLEQHQSSR